MSRCLLFLMLSWFLLFSARAQTPDTTRLVPPEILAALRAFAKSVGYGGICHAGGSWSSEGGDICSGRHRRHSIEILNQGLS
jgi:hypothetical protein